MALSVESYLQPDERGLPLTLTTNVPVLSFLCKVVRRNFPWTSRVKIRSKTVRINLTIARLSTTMGKESQPHQQKKNFLHAPYSLREKKNSPIILSFVFCTDTFFVRIFQSDEMESQQKVESVPKPQRKLFTQEKMFPESFHTM